MVDGACVSHVAETSTAACEQMIEADETLLVKALLLKQVIVIDYLIYMENFSAYHWWTLSSYKTVARPVLHQHIARTLFSFSPSLYVGCRLV